MGIRRGHRAKPLEWLSEKIILLVSLTAILLTLLIFVFIGREALPVALGQVNTARTQKTIPVADMNKLTELELRDYLGLTKGEYARMDRETLKTLMELKREFLQSSMSITFRST